MNIKFNILIFVICTILLFNGCSDPEKVITNDKNINNEIELISDEEIVNASDIELLSIEVMDKPDSNYLFVTTLIKNNSTNTKKTITIYLKYYDKNGMLIDTRTDTISNIAPGETCKFESEILDIDKEISRIKIDKISVIDDTEDTSKNQSVTKTIDDIVKSCSRTLVYNNLVAPATAQWVSDDIVDKDNYGRYIVDTKVDAQNLMGALIRASYIVVLQSVNEDDTFEYRDMFYIQEYENDYERESAISLLKSFNDWNENPEIKKDEHIFTDIEAVEIVYQQSGLSKDSDNFFAASTEISKDKYGKEYYIVYLNNKIDIQNGGSGTGDRLRVYEDGTVLSDYDGKPVNFDNYNLYNKNEMDEPSITNDENEKDNSSTPDCESINVINLYLEVRENISSILGNDFSIEKDETDTTYMIYEDISFGLNDENTIVSIIVNKEQQSNLEKFNAYGITFNNNNKEIFDALGEPYFGDKSTFLYKYYFGWLKLEFDNEGKMITMRVFQAPDNTGGAGFEW